MMRLILTSILVLSFGFGASADIRAGTAAYQAKDYAKAAEILLRQIKSGKLTAAERSQAQLFLGFSFYRLQLKQIAAFPLIQLVKEGSKESRKKALDLIVAIANSLDETSMLHYGLGKLKPEEVSETGMSVVFFRLGEIAQSKGDYAKAASMYRISLDRAPESEESLYGLALTHLQAKQPEKAIPYYRKLLDMSAKKSVTDRKRGMATLGLARSYYQSKNWSEAAELYRKIPKDHAFYRESLMELAWSLFREGKFRSALSPLQSLHTPFYQNFYDPESMLLHGIILLFSCRYDEMKPIVHSFQQTYPPAIAKTQEWISGARSVQEYYNEIDAAITAVANQRKGLGLKTENKLPFFVVRTLLDDSEITAEIRYLSKLKVERQLLSKKFSSRPVIAYGNAILDGRAKAARTRMATYMQKRLKQVVTDFAEFSLQMDFLKYEMLGGERKKIKDQMAGVGLNLDANQSRDYYIQNGYRFWPQQEEFWRDEMGSYQYVGANLCEDN